MVIVVTFYHVAGGNHRPGAGITHAASGTYTTQSGGRLLAALSLAWIGLEYRATNGRGFVV
jgi:hypothetical protein